MIYCIELLVGTFGECHDCFKVSFARSHQTYRDRDLQERISLSTYNLQDQGNPIQ